MPSAPLHCAFPQQGFQVPYKQSIDYSWVSKIIRATIQNNITVLFSKIVFTKYNITTADFICRPLTDLLNKRCWCDKVDRIQLFFSSRFVCGFPAPSSRFASWQLMEPHAWEMFGQSSACFCVLFVNVFAWSWQEELVFWLVLWVNMSLKALKLQPHINTGNIFTCFVKMGLIVVGACAQSRLESSKMLPEIFTH